MKIKTLLTSILSAAMLGHAGAQSPATPAATKYLTFQVQTGLHGYASQFHPAPGRFSLTKAQMEEFVHSLVKPIGMTGDARHKLAFAVGPLCFDMPDDETRQFIRDAFAVARENDVAVAFHIDDSMGWGERKDLLANPDNIETADWKQIPNKARSLQWGVKPTEFPPQMCYNAPAIVAAAKARAKLIGGEIARELAALKSQGKEHLFACVMAGWETQISPEFGTNRKLGFRALAHRGFSEKNPPKDLGAERVSVVKEWIELWCKSLQAAGAPREKIFCHIAITDQGVRKAGDQESYAEKVAFAPPEVAFSSAYRPGFSSYPEGRNFPNIYDALAAHGSPGWISAEGTNVSPTTMPGEPTMETYLAKMFNHGAVLVNVFSWGIGGEAQRENFFRKATENPQALADYAKFLRGEKLIESAAHGFSSSSFQEKMQKVQAGLPAWIQKTGRQSEATALMQKIQALAKEHKWPEVDKTVNELLALIEGAPPTTKTETPATQPPPPANSSADDVKKRLTEKVERVKQGARKWAESGRDPSVIGRMMEEKFKPLMDAGKVNEAETELDRVLEQLNTPAAPETPKSGAMTREQRLPLMIQKIHTELPAWMAKADPEAKAKATALMQTLKEQAKDSDPQALEQTADALLELIGGVGPRITEKIARVRQGVQKWVASGRDPSAILKTMSEKVGPLIHMETGKTVEAEAELDRVLAVLGQDGKSSAAADAAKTPADPVAAGVFPPELVFLAQDRIALTPEQLEKFRARLGKTQLSSGGAAVSVKDLLTPEQLAKLGRLGLEMAKDHAVFLKLEEESGKRISAKAERVKAGAQAWTDSGRDASAISKAIEEQYKPLMEADKVFEAEAVLDRILGNLKQNRTTK